MIELNFQNKTPDQKWTAKFFKSVLEKSAKEKKTKIDKSLDYSLSVILVGESKIKKLNKKYRGKNKITDVLSFPLSQNVIGGVPSRYDIIDLGDIFICLSFVKKMVKKNNTSIENELVLLIIHGFLHLLGFDHEKDMGEMKNIQNKIFNNIKFRNV